MKLQFSLIFILLLNLGCAQSKSKPITEFSQNDINDGILVDARTPEEYDAGHIDNAQNVDWFDADFVSKFDTVSKSKTIFVYCKKGGRSAKAARLLDSLGYQNVIDLEGGYDSYSKK